MARMIIPVLWTLATGYLLLHEAHKLAPLERAVFVALPFIGLFLCWQVWVDLRRRRSLQVQTEGGLSLYVWNERNGTECRSFDDPRPDWDRDDDGDSDGDGGD